MRIAETRSSVNQTILLDNGLRQKALKKCKKQQKSLSQLIREALSAYLERDEIGDKRTDL